MSLKFFAPAGVKPARDKKERDDGDVNEVSHRFISNCEPWERRRLVGVELSVARQRAGGTPALPGGGRMVAPKPAAR